MPKEGKKKSKHLSWRLTEEKQKQALTLHLCFCGIEHPQGLSTIQLVFNCGAHTEHALSSSIKSESH